MFDNRISNRAPIARAKCVEIGKMRQPADVSRMLESFTNGLSGYSPVVICTLLAVACSAPYARFDRSEVEKHAVRL